jgi:hypothetical protein
MIGTRNLISFEALSVNRANAPLLTKLVSFVEDAGVYVREQLNNINPLNHNIAYGSINRKLTHVNYTDVSSVVVPVPAGLSVTWLEYLTVLRASQRFVMGLYDDTLRPFEVFLGAALNDPERLKNIIDGHAVTITDLKPLREDMANCLKHGSSTTAPLGKCIKRLTDWELVTKETRDLIDSQKQIPQSLILESIANIDEKLQLLVQRMSDSNEKYRPRPEMINDLADLTYRLAEKVTFYAIYVAQYNAYLISLENAVETIQKKVK